MVMTGARHSVARVIRVAVLFWTLYVVLAFIEAAFGENVISSIVFLLSIPSLVAALIFVNWRNLRSRARRCVGLRGIVGAGVRQFDHPGGRCCCIFSARLVGVTAAPDEPGAGHSRPFSRASSRRSSLAGRPSAC